MNKLEVGMYVRFDRCQGIRKIIDYDNECKWYELDEDIYDEWGDICGVIHNNDKDVLNASYNIIDLIEVGDYVNGFEVEFVDKKDKIIICYTATFEEEDIKSIVTKEQFESWKYTV